jgi:pimeloyl-ACP methyl ester carboxylesterase
VNLTEAATPSGSSSSAASADVANMVWVLLPGMDGTGDLFAPFVEALGANVSVVVVRYPPDQALGYAGLETVARAALPVDRPYVLLGESFSGPIAVSIAATRPPMLRGLVLCGSFARNPQPLLKPFRAVLGRTPIAAVPMALVNGVLLGRFSTPALRASLRAALAQISQPAMQSRVDAVLTADVSTQLAAVVVPILYLRATHDRVVGAAAWRWILEVQPNAQTAAIEAPHLLLQAAPVAAARAVAAFTQSL